MANRALGLVGGGDELPSDPHAAARLVGAVLRQYREDRGLRLADVVGRVSGINSNSTLSRYETGRTKLNEDTVVGLYRFYGVTDPESLAEVRALVSQSVKQEWWAPYHDVVPAALGRLFALEKAATDIHTYQAFYVPGLLQTADYARAVMRAPHRKLLERDAQRESEEQVRRRLYVRMQRQHLLDQPDAPEYSALIDEAVLCKPTGGRAVMRGQLRSLYNQAENKSRIHIRILPFEAAEEATALTSAMTVFKLPAAHGGDMVYVETTNRPQGGTYLTSTDEVEAHRASMEELWTLAGSKHDALQLLQKHIDRLAD
ncbi:helix-turn-helix domain-containing protein [Streptomyces hawaiiensis]|uniref:helix-turn-helix domain-containing protein n=1 Tax=Streptomyces hawaiiensis TaxID=67305 RepID=UPI0036594E38